MELTFHGELFEWRGPPPYYFVIVPEDESDEIHQVASAVTYGWGMIPVAAQIGGTKWETALWPKNDLYVLPVKVAVRRAENIDDGDVVDVEMTVKGPSRSVTTPVRT